jgi:hypothetical protein
VMNSRSRVETGAIVSVTDTAVASDRGVSTLSLSSPQVEDVDGDCWSIVILGIIWRMQVDGMDWMGTLKGLEPQWNDRCRGRECRGCDGWWVRVRWQAELCWAGSAWMLNYHACDDHLKR